MIEFIEGYFAYWMCFLQLTIGLYGILFKRNLMKKVIGLTIFQASIILFFIILAYKEDQTVPIYDAGLEGAEISGYINPLTHALMLTAIVAPIGAKVAAYVIIRLVHDVFPFELVEGKLYIFEILLITGAVAIIWGSVMALPQRNLKRMLAYSSVAQIGYIALGLGLASPFGFIGAVLHVLNHAVMKACLFLVSARLEERGVGG